MLLNDSIDFEDLQYCVSAEAVPLKVDVCLKDIWIPSQLLPNRNTAPDFNKGGIFHTLEKPYILDEFSVYFDKDLEISNFSTEDTATEVNQNITTLEVSSQLPSLENVPSSVDDNVYLPESLANISNDKKHQLMRSSTITKDSLEDIFYSEEKLNEHVKLDGNEKSELTQSYADLPNSDNTEQKLCESDIPECPNEAVVELPIAYQRPEHEEKLNELVKSDENEKSDPTQFYANLLNLDNTDETLCESNIPECPNVTVIELPIAYQRPEREEKLNELVKSDGNEKSDPTQFYADLLNSDNTDQTLCESDIPECPNVTVIKLPIAYQRPELEETTSKHRPQKEKKSKKKAAKNNLHLAEFLQIINDCDGYEEPEKDEFYENLVRQGLCKPPEQLVENVAEFPESYRLPEMEFLKYSEYVDIQNELSLKNFTKDECEITVPNCEEEKKIEPVQVKPETLDGTLSTIIIENIPKSVTQENIESIVLGYGELKKMSLKPCGEFLKAQLEMNFECEVDWIVECLNGSEPFGASNDGVMLKCYELRS